MVRVLVLSSIFLFTSVVPAFAEKVTLACSADPNRYVIIYITIDTDAKTVTDSHTAQTYPAQITADTVTWEDSMASVPGPGPISTYNRNTAILSGGFGFNGASVPCKRAPPPPF